MPQQPIDILQEFADEHRLKYSWRKAKDETDGVITFRIRKMTVSFTAEVKSQINLAQVPVLAAKKSKTGDLLLIANYISAIVQTELVNAGLNYIDAAGNAHIEADGIHLHIEGKKGEDLRSSEKINPFSKAGLKVIFLLLTEKSYLGATIREVAEMADVSKDSASKTINWLKQLNYLVPVSDNKLEWKNKEEVIQRWANEYNQRLKPTLLIGNFTFVRNDDFNHWQDMLLNTPQTQWGGEAAAELVFRIPIKAATLTMYTTESKIDLMRNYRIAPAYSGRLQIYRRFWKWKDGTTDNKVHPIILYADMLNASDPRSMIAAQEIYTRYVQG